MIGCLLETDGYRREFPQEHKSVPSAGGRLMRLISGSYAPVTLIAGVLLLLLAGCDPCTGVSSCGGATAIRYEGAILLRSSGEPAMGVRVEFVRTAGVRIGRDTLSTQTDSEGRFRLEAPASEHGDVLGVLSIYLPGPGDPSRVPVTLSTLRSSANVAHLGTFVVPRFHLPYVGAIVYAVTQEPARDVEVEFRRVSGVRLERETYVTKTDQTGLFSLNPIPLEPGVVIARLIVRPPAPYDSLTIRDVRLETIEGEVPPRLVGRWELVRRVESPDP